MLLVFSFSCSSQGDSNDPIEKLTAYCIRQCVLSTAASELCDTKCKCAAKNLSDELSKEEFNNLVLDLSNANNPNPENVEKLSKALDSCKTERE